VQTDAKNKSATKHRAGVLPGVLIVKVAVLLYIFRPGGPNCTQTKNFGAMQEFFETFLNFFTKNTCAPTKVVLK